VPARNILCRLERASCADEDHPYFLNIFSLAPQTHRCHLRHPQGHPEKTTAPQTHRCLLYSRAMPPLQPGDVFFVMRDRLRLLRRRGTFCAGEEHLVPARNILCRRGTSCAGEEHLAPVRNILCLRETSCAGEKHLVPMMNILCRRGTSCAGEEHLVPARDR
jgi:hypothetical protein